MTTFIFRRQSGKIEYLPGETADHDLNKIGQRFSWDSDMNSVDVRLPSGKVEKIVLNGVKQ